jgi:hypothetical protein
MASRESHQEIEIKRLLVGEHAVDRLTAALGPATSDRMQFNHVFDTDELCLEQQFYALRLRFEDGTPTLTAKGPSRRVGSSASARAEAEATIEPRLAAEILAGRRDPLEVLQERARDAAFTVLWTGIGQARGGRALREVGRFENRRRSIPVTLPNGLELVVELDHTCFAGGRVDDEVEIEVPGEQVVSEVEAWLERRAAAAGVATRPSTPKLARFYAALREPPR